MTTFDFIVYQILSDKIRRWISKTNELKLHKKRLHWTSAIGTFDLPFPFFGENNTTEIPTSGCMVWIGPSGPEQSNLLELQTTKIIEQLERN